mgnify:CR=1 FL=1
MNPKRLREELLHWCIDHADVPLPRHLRQAVENSPELQREWKRMQAWRDVLSQQESWVAGEAFYQQLADKAMREKNRAAITHPADRQLTLETFSWGDLFSPAVVRYALVVPILLLLLLPTGWYAYEGYQTIGEVRYVEGNVVAMGQTASQVRRDDSLRRGEAIQTTAQARTLVELENGVFIYLDARTQLALENGRELALQRGRAFFEVRPGEGSFQVQVPGGQVAVLGTSFMINLQEAQPEVMVLEGRVAFTTPERAIEMQAGQIAHLHPNGQIQRRSQANLNARLNWVERMQEKNAAEEMNLFFPSLAGPTPALREGQR